VSYFDVRLENFRLVGSEHQAREHQGLDLETRVGRPVLQRLFDAGDEGGEVVDEAIGQHDHQLPQDREDADLQDNLIVRIEKAEVLHCMY
jgi:hypothetical protein